MKTIQETNLQVSTQLSTQQSHRKKRKQSVLQGRRACHPRQCPNRLHRSALLVIQVLSSRTQVSSDVNVSTDEDLPGIKQPSDRVPTLPTFKLVGDNLDKSVRPRDMRMDSQTQALHYFHMYAVRDRINLAEFTDNPSLPEVSLADLKTILPTTQDQEVLQKNFAILIARTLTKHMPFFKKFGSGLERHLVHERYEEMSAKSEVVSVYITTKIAKTEVPIRLDTECLQKDTHSEHKFVLPCSTSYPLLTGIL